MRNQAGEAIGSAGYDAATGAMRVTTRPFKEFYRGLTGGGQYVFGRKTFRQREVIVSDSFLTAGRDQDPSRLRRVWPYPLAIGSGIETVPRQAQPTLKVAESLTQLSPRTDVQKIANGCPISEGRRTTISDKRTT
jgi:hypothetical protein